MGRVTPSTEMSKLLADSDGDIVVLDDDAFGAEIDDLYHSQEQNYQDLMDSMAAIQQQQAALEQTQGSPFARTEVMEAELELQTQKMAKALEDYLANSELLSQVAQGMDDEALERFNNLDGKFVEALEPLLPEEEPEVPEPPKMLTPTPVGRYFISTGEKMICPFAMGGQAVFSANPARKVLLEGKQMGNVMDFQPIVCIPSFGMCSSLANPQVASATAAAFGALTPMPCAPNTVAPWKPGKPDLLVENAPALLNTDTCQCLWGGVISFVPQPPTPPPAPSAINTDGDHTSDATTSVENLATEALRIGAQKYGNLAAKLLSKAGVLGKNGIVLANLRMLQDAVKYGRLAKGLKVAGKVLTVGVIAYDALTADTSVYAQSLADAQKKHSGRIDSIDELGARGGDYLGGALKEIGLPDGVADSVNFAVRESIQTISAPGELTYELGKAVGLDKVGESIGSSLAERFPAPDWLIDIFG